MVPILDNELWRMRTLKNQKGVRVIKVSENIFLVAWRVERIQFWGTLQRIELQV